MPAWCLEGPEKVILLPGQPRLRVGHAGQQLGRPGLGYCGSVGRETAVEGGVGIGEGGEGAIALCAVRGVTVSWAWSWTWSRARGRFKGPEIK